MTSRDERTELSPVVPWSFLAVGQDEVSENDCKCVVLPIPYDSTSSYMTGCKEGPNAIIDASRYLEDYDIELQREIYKIGILTLPEMEAHVGSPEQMIARVKSFVQPYAKRGKLLAVLGGEHSISVGVVSAVKEVYQDISVLYLDAHGDLRDEYMGSKYSHACSARRICEMCPIVQVGVRSISSEEMDFVRANNLNVNFHSESAKRDSWDLNKIFTGLSKRVYISIDLDVFDLGLMPSVGTPEPGGLEWNSVLSLLRAICEQREVVGFDITELCPRAGSTYSSFVAAKLAYKVIGYATQRNMG